MPDPDFYITGGTIPSGAPSYIARQADEELLTALRRGEICYVLNARQMGKSSLCVRTRAALEREGVRTAFLDLQKFGSSATAEQWYRSLLERLGHDLKLRAPFLAYWRDNAERTPIDRLFGALRDVVLEQLPGSIVVFLDEIDVVHDFDFKTDEFFAAIRQCYNARATDTAFTRLTFCIIGTVAPTDLIRDVRLSPFNIGTRVKLADFTPSEAAPLSAPLPGGSTTLDRVLWWTAGHPYLTQRLCSELSKAGSRDVDAMVAQLFLAKSDADVDENIKNVRNGLLRMGGEGAGFDRVDLFMRYGRIVSGRHVVDDDTDAICTALRLSGLVSSVGGILHVRNRVYAKLFDSAWVRANLPEAETRRQHAARLKGFLTAAIPSLIALTIVTCALVFANRKTVNERNANKLARSKTLEAVKAKQDSDTLATTKSKLARDNGKLANDLKDKNRELDAKNQKLLNAIAAQARSLSELKAAKRKSEALTKKESRARKLADAKTELAENLAYDSSMALIERLAENAVDPIRIRKILDQAPVTQRRFEWYYWNKTIPKIDSTTLKAHASGVNAVALSQDGQTLVTGSGDKTARIWDMRTGQTVRILAGHTDIVNAVALSQEGRTLVTGSRDGTARLWDVQTGQTLRTFQGHTGSVEAVALSQDGKTLITGSSDHSARIWDVTTGQTLLVLNGHRDAVTAVTLSQDGETAVTGGGDMTARIWDVKTGQTAFTLTAGIGTVTAVALSQNGRTLVTGSWDGTAQIWDVKTGRLVRTLRGHREYILTVALSQDGTTLVTGSSDRTARVWDMRTGQTRLILTGHTDRVKAAALSQDGKTVVTGSDDRTVRIWNVKTGQPLIILKGHTFGVNAVAFSQDGRTLATGSWDSTARIWDVKTGETRLILKGHTGNINAVALSQDGWTLVTGSDDHTVRVWDLKTGQTIRVLTGHTGAVWAVAFSQDGRTLVTGSDDHTARIWAVKTGRTIRTLTGHSQRVWAVALSEDGRTLVTGSVDHTARIWDMKTGQTIRVLAGHTGNISAVALSHDGRTIVTGSWDKTARIWNVKAGHTMRILEGHTEPLSSVALSEDGKTLITGSYDGTARIWDAKTGQSLLTLSGNTGLVRAVSLSQDGRIVALGGDKVMGSDENARIWDTR